MSFFIPFIKQSCGPIYHSQKSGSDDFIVDLAQEQLSSPCGVLHGPLGLELPFGQHGLWLPVFCAILSQECSSGIRFVNLSR